MNDSKIRKAYSSSKNIYDNVLTKGSWLSKLYVKLFWDLDDVEIANRLFEYIPKNFSGNLLDVPVGTGVFTFDIYRSLNNAEITCLDYSSDMLEQAEKRFNQLDNITLVQGDVGDMSFEDKSFDILLSMNGFHAFPDKEKAFKETYRVLKPGGMFLGCFYVKREKAASDFIVKNLLTPKGWFTPPFMTKIELYNKLSTLYSEVEVSSHNAIASFKCIK